MTLSIMQYGLEDRYHALGDENKGDPKPKDKGPKVDKTKAALKDKAHTPIAGEGASSDSTGAVVPDVYNMSDDELDAIPAKMLARMRGDIV